MFAAVSNKDIFLSCYNCFEKYAKENPDMIKQTKMKII